MDIKVGTSGFSYEPWVGKFYPEGLPASKMLAFYGERFRAVEVNNTFYRLPNAKMLRGWRDQVGETFTFALKANQRFSTPAKLEQPAELVETWHRLAGELGAKLGPTFIQFARWAKKDLVVLERLLAALPCERKHALEFRNPGWHGDDTYALLGKYDVALVISESDEARDPRVSTASHGYLRLRKSAYTDAELAAWCSFVRAQAWSTAHVFLKHEDEGRGPVFAERFMALAAKAGAARATTP